MVLTTVKKALEQYAQSAECSAEERQQVFEALTECSEVAERYESRDTWRDVVYVVSSDALADLLNVATYDMFGELIKAHGDNMQFMYYTHAVRKKLNSELTNGALELGYGVLYDLWCDNEAYGRHNPDGTLNRNNHAVFNEVVMTRLRRCINTAKENVQATLLVNADVLESGEVHKLAECLTDADYILNIIGNN